MTEAPKKWRRLSVWDWALLIFVSSDVLASAVNFLEDRYDKATWFLVCAVFLVTVDAIRARP